MKWNLVSESKVIWFESQITDPVVVIQMFVLLTKGYGKNILLTDFLLQYTWMQLCENKLLAKFCKTILRS